MNEAWFFIGLFVFILLVWIALGGPTRGVPLSFPAVSYSGARTETTGTSTSGTSLLRSVALPQAPFGIGTSQISLPSFSGFGFSADGSQRPLIDVPGVSLPASSPYRGRVTLSHHIANASSSDARTEYVALNVANDRGASVDISGWQLVSGATSHRAYIPRGTAMPTAGAINPVSDIVLAPGEGAYLISGISPIGASFRENKCTGYLGSVQNFTPTLSRECPSAANELYNYYGKPYIHDPDCIDYANSLGTCRMPTAAGEAKLNLTCQDFLDTYLNYNGCVAAHGSDQDFAGTIWHIYLGRDNDEPLWRDRYEVVELLDQNGRTVDAFTY